MKILKELLELCDESDQTLMIMGKHGVGKSEAIIQYAEEKGYYLETLILSTLDVGDLTGLPYVANEAERKVVRWAIPSYIKRIKRAFELDQKSILFLDEMNRGDRDVLNTSLDIILNKRIGNHELPLNTMMVSAINPPGEDYTVNDMDPALVDRFLVYEIQINVQSWLTWAKSKGVLKVITNYIEDFPDHLHMNIQSENDITSPSNRSWKMLHDVLIPYQKKHQTLEHDSNEVIKSLIDGKLGSVIGKKFLNYYKNYKGDVTETNDKTSGKKVNTNWDNINLNTSGEERPTFMKNHFKDPTENVVQKGASEQELKKKELPKAEEIFKIIKENWNKELKIEENYKEISKLINQKTKGIKRNLIIETAGKIIDKYLGKNSSSNHVIGIFLYAIPSDMTREVIQNVKVLNSKKYEYLIKNISLIDISLK